MTFRACVLIPDNERDVWGDIFDPAGIELPNGPVPVRGEFMKDLDHYLGVATLSKGEDGSIYADIDFFRPENPALCILSPSIGGVVQEREHGVIKRCTVTDLGLTVCKNADRRIARLGDQGYKP